MNNTQPCLGKSLKLVLQVADFFLPPPFQNVGNPTASINLRYLLNILVPYCVYVFFCLSRPTPQ